MKLRLSIGLVSILFTVVLLFHHTVDGQVAQSELSGYVLDQNGDSIRGATVKLTDAATGVSTNAQSGIRVAISQATNFNAAFGFGSQRPNLNHDPRLPANERTTTRWFDTSAFSQAPQFTLGSSSRNPVRGPAYRNIDLAVLKRTSFTERLDLEFRAEVFNLTNTPPLGNPNTQFGSSAFGTITSAGDPRIVQFGVKLNF